VRRLQATYKRQPDTDCDKREGSRGY
jgi:hypothetical protein